MSGEMRMTGAVAGLPPAGLPPSGLPLAGVRVVDLTRFVSGAYATMMLAALGADVVKVEPPAGGDSYRAQATATVADRSALFLSLNNGKRSLALDLRAPAGQAALERLLAGADVLVENARPGALARYGLDAEAVLARHPRIVYGSVSGYGQTGPDASRGGFDLILQAEAGLMSVTGTAESGPVKVGAPLLDVGAGICAVTGILAALLRRAETGLGGHVSSSLLEFALAGLTTPASAYFAAGEIPSRLGTHSPSFAPYGAFRARTGELVLAGAGNEALWRRLCVTIGIPEAVDDPAFATNADRVRNRDALTARIETALAADDAPTWVARLEAAGVPAGLVRDVGEALTSAQATAIGAVAAVATPDGIPYQAVTVPLRAPGPLSFPSGAPDLGQHTREVLREAGLSDPEIDELRTAGTILDGSPARDTPAGGTPAGGTTGVVEGSR
ncbi:CaiB/BaiF CoA-transferase family protein [Frankia sp. EI5c]|uniref:CaiB/BaiF CoA transferase family protein n=1 Tax=Frankia sp. EI5c TaxID=683316 RepID=UPI0018FE1E7B|nr:CoA transferase [Frankia sp. EI5c]